MPPSLEGSLDRITALTQLAGKAVPAAEPGILTTEAWLTTAMNVIHWVGMIWTLGHSQGWAAALIALSNALGNGAYAAGRSYRKKGT